jgi:hypothetical protein
MRRTGHGGACRETFRCAHREELETVIYENGQWRPRRQPSAGGGAHRDDAVARPARRGGETDFMEMLTMLGTTSHLLDDEPDAG